MRVNSYNVIRAEVCADKAVVVVIHNPQHSLNLFRVKSLNASDNVWFPLAVHQFARDVTSC